MLTLSFPIFLTYILHLPSYILIKNEVFLIQIRKNSAIRNLSEPEGSPSGAEVPPGWSLSRRPHSELLWSPYPITFVFHPIPPSPHLPILLFYLPIPRSPDFPVSSSCFSIGSLIRKVDPFPTSLFASMSPL